MTLDKFLREFTNGNIHVNGTDSNPNDWWILISEEEFAGQSLLHPIVMGRQSSILEDKVMIAKLLRRELIQTTIIVEENGNIIWYMQIAEEV